MSQNICMVHLDGTTLNQIVDILGDWNRALKDSFLDNSGPHTGLEPTPT